MKIWIVLAILIALYAVLFTYGNRHKGEKKDVLAVLAYGICFIGLSIWASL